VLTSRTCSERRLSYSRISVNCLPPLVPLCVLCVFVVKRFLREFTQSGTSLDVRRLITLFHEEIAHHVLQDEVAFFDVTHV
jgi:hypothetical protein